MTTFGRRIFGGLLAFVAFCICAVAGLAAVGGNLGALAITLLAFVLIFYGLHLAMDTPS